MGQLRITNVDARSLRRVKSKAPALHSTALKKASLAKINGNNHTGFQDLQH